MPKSKRQPYRHPDTNLSTAEEVALIRKAIRTAVPGASVRRGRGTGSGWVDVYPPVNHDDFTPDESEALSKMLGIDTRNGFNIAPHERSLWAKNLQADPKARFQHLEAYWD